MRYDLAKSSQSELKIRGWEMGEMLRAANITNVYLSQIGKSKYTFYEWFNLAYRGTNVMSPTDVYAIIHFISKHEGGNKLLADMEARLIEMRANNEFELLPQLANSARYEATIQL